MGLFKKKCEYCRKKIKRGREISKKINDPVFKNLKEKTFCSLEHAEIYEKEISLKKCR